MDIAIYSYFFKWICWSSFRKSEQSIHVRACTISFPSASLVYYKAILSVIFVLIQICVYAYLLNVERL